MNEVVGFFIDKKGVWNMFKLYKAIVSVFFFVGGSILLGGCSPTDTKATGHITSPKGKKAVKKTITEEKRALDVVLESMKEKNGDVVVVGEDEDIPLLPPESSEEFEE